MALQEAKMKQIAVLIIYRCGLRTKELLLPLLAPGPAAPSAAVASSSTTHFCVIVSLDT